MHTTPLTFWTLPNPQTIHPCLPELLFIIIELHSLQPIKQDIFFLTTCSSPLLYPILHHQSFSVTRPLKAFWLAYNGGHRGVRGCYRTGLCAQELWCLSICVGGKGRGDGGGERWGPLCQSGVLEQVTHCVAVWTHDGDYIVWGGVSWGMDHRPFCYNDDVVLCLRALTGMMGTLTPNVWLWLQ